MLEPSDSAECHGLHHAGLRAVRDGSTRRCCCGCPPASPTRSSSSWSSASGRRAINLPYDTQSVAKNVMMPAMAKPTPRGGGGAAPKTLRAVGGNVPVINRVEYDGREDRHYRRRHRLPVRAGRRWATRRSLLEARHGEPPAGEADPRFRRAASTRLYVIEELDDVIETHCQKAGHARSMGKELFSAVRRVLPADDRGKLLGERDGDDAQLAGGRSPSVRPCSAPGCPHRGLFYVLEKAAS